MPEQDKRSIISSIESYAVKRNKPLTYDEAEADKEKRRLGQSVQAYSFMPFFIYPADERKWDQLTSRCDGINSETVGLAQSYNALTRVGSVTQLMVQSIHAIHTEIGRAHV